MRTAIVTEQAIIEVLRAGEVAILPTDTLYGLAALPGTNGVATIFELKGRPPDKPLPVCGYSLDHLRAVAVFDKRAAALAEAFWPGPLTLVLARADGFDHDLGGNVDSVAVRVPDRAATLRVLEATGPLAVTSANVSGRPPAADAATAATAFEGLPILDDGPARGEASTILSLVDGVALIRDGALDVGPLIPFSSSGKEPGNN